MRKTDIGVVAFMYLVCAYFYSQTITFKADSQTYPKFTIVLLFGLTTLYLLQMVAAAKKHGVESGVTAWRAAWTRCSRMCSLSSCSCASSARSPTWC